MRIRVFLQVSFETGNCWNKTTEKGREEKGTWANTPWLCPWSTASHYRNTNQQKVCFSCFQFSILSSHLQLVSRSLIPFKLSLQKIILWSFSSGGKNPEQTIFTSQCHLLIFTIQDWGPCLPRCWQGTAHSQGQRGRTDSVGLPPSES